MDRTLIVDIIVIDPRVGDNFGFEVTNDGLPLVFTQSGQIDSNGWKKTYITSVDTRETIPSNRIVKLNDDLTYRPESALFSLFNNNVILDLIIKNTGFSHAVGGFTLYNNTTSNRFVSFNEVGSAVFQNPGFNAPVITVKELSDGSLIFGGIFTAFGSIQVNRLFKRLPSGAADTTFNNNIMNAATNKGFNGSVETIAVQSNGRILLGGSFNIFNNNTRNRIVRLNANGTIDNTFNVGTGFGNGFVNSIAIQPDGRILVGGSFTTYKGVAVGQLVRLDASGNLDTAFNTAIGNGTNFERVNLVKVYNNEIYVGGRFAAFNGNATRSIVKLSLAGAVISLFGTGFGNTQDFPTLLGTVRDIDFLADNTILVGGSFDSYNGTTIKNFAKISTVGALSSDRIDFNGPVYKVVVNSGFIYVAGDFTSTSSGSLIPGISNLYNIPITSTMSALEATYATYDNLVEFNSGVGITYSISVGQPLTSTNLFTSPSLYLTDFSTPAADGSYFLYGSFLQYNGLAATRVIKLKPDGSQDFSFNTTLGGPNEDPYSGCRLYRLSNDGLLVAGAFSTYNGVAGFGIRKLNPDGSLDTSLTPRVFGTSGGFRYTTKVELQPNGKILLAGLFSSYDGFTSGKLVRINADGSYDSTFNVGSGFNNTTIDVVVNEDFTMYVTGYFSSYKGVAASGIIKLSATASIDTSFIYGSGFSPNGQPVVNYLLPTIGDNNSVYCVGGFTSYKGATANRIIKLTATGSVDSSFNIGTGFNDIVDTIRYTNNNQRIFLSGQFTSYNGTPTERAVILNLDGSIAQTFTGTGFDSYYTIGNTLYATDNNYLATFQNLVRMTYTFNEDQVVLNNLYETTNFVEIEYTNNSVTINELIDEIVVRSPYLIISTQSSFDSANYQVRVWEGSIFTAASQSVLYNITKPKLFLGQQNVYVNINNLVRERLEANISNFMSLDYDFAKPLSENMSKWVQVNESLTDVGATVSTSVYRFFATDGYLHNNEVQAIPNILMTGNQRYIHKDQLERIYFQTNYLTRIEVRFTDGFGDYDAYWNVDLLGDNKNYVQSLIVDTRYFPFGNPWVEYRFEYSNSATEVVRFNIYDYSCKYDPFTLVYKNKWGILESIGLTKKSSKKLATTAVDFERSILDYNGNFDITRHTKKQLNVNGYESWVLNTDWMPEYMNQALEEIKLSEEVWLLDSNNTPIPIIIEDNTIDYKTVVNDKLIQYTIKVKMSQQVIKNIL